MKKLWKNNKKILKFIFLGFIFWQVAINLLNFIIPYTGIPAYGYKYTEKKIINPPFFWNRANFDGIHYLDIARKGYGIYQQAFFPLYPRLIRFLTPFFGGRNLITALFISNFSFLMAIFIFYKLVRIDCDEKIAQRAIIFLLFFPTSFFFGMVYTESLFLMLILGSFYAVRKEKWLLSGILGALAANTRLVGIFLLPGLLWEWWEQRKTSNLKTQISNLFSISIVSIGLFSYMRFLWKYYGDPLMFIHVQPFFGAQRSGGRIILLYQVFWRYFKMILTTKLDPLYFTVWLEMLTSIGILLILYLAYKKGIRLSYLIFAALAYVTPALSGTFSSLPRYSLVLFPCFVYFGTIKNTFVRNLLLLIFGTIFVISAVFFFQGYWIS